MSEEKEIKIGEEFKNKIQKKFPEKQGRIYGITSGKGGVGKTSFAAMLAYGVASQGYSTLIIDLDTGLRNLDIIMGVDAYIVHNLYEVLERGEDFANAAIKAPGPKDKDGNTINSEKLPWICVSIQEKIKNAIGYEPLTKLLNKLRDIFDVIILDGPAGIEYGSKLVTLCADEYFIVCTPNNASVRGADQINKMQIQLIGEERPARVVVNQMIPEMVASDGALSSEDIASYLQLPVAITLPMDVSVSYCGHNGLSVWHMEGNNIKPILKDFVERYFPVEIKSTSENTITASADEDVKSTDKQFGKNEDTNTPGQNQSITEEGTEQEGKKEIELQENETKTDNNQKKGFFARLFGCFGKREKSKEAA